MEVVFALVGAWLLLACVLAPLVGGSPSFGDELWEQARDEEKDWDWPRRSA